MATRRFDPQLLPELDPQLLLERAGQGKTIAAYQPGAAIMGQGSGASLIFYLQSGVAKETVEMGNGKGAVIAVLEPGMFFGTRALHIEKPMLSSVTAITTCIVTAIEIDVMHGYLKIPRFASLFMNYLLRHTSILEGEKIDLLFDNSERLLAKRLLTLAHFGGDDQQTISTDITQDMLAEMIGTTRPRVNYFLNKFRKAGLIKYNGGIRVTEELARLVEAPPTDRTED